MVDEEKTKWNDEAIYVHRLAAVDGGGCLTTAADSPLLSGRLSSPRFLGVTGFSRVNPLSLSKKYNGYSHGNFNRKIAMCQEFAKLNTLA